MASSGGAGVSTELAIRTAPLTFPSFSLAETGTANLIGSFGRKKDKYGCLDSAYLFTPIAIELPGACGTNPAILEVPR